jgi:hypothetical protein
LKTKYLAVLGIAAAGLAPLPAYAQAAPAAPAPAGQGAPAEQAGTDPVPTELPDLNFQPDPEAEKNFDKYFYFHREGTDFATAYADLQECDGYARGLSYRAGGGAVPYPYAGTLGGAIGGAIGSAMADAIFGSAERRRQRRATMRTCMGFKEYRAYGLPKDIWTKFNFEEGLSHVDDDRRQRLLQLQAKAASGPTPRTGEITG